MITLIRSLVSWLTHSMVGGPGHVGATEAWSPLAELRQAGTRAHEPSGLPPTRAEMLAADRELHEHLAAIERRFVARLESLIGEALCRLGDAEELGAPA